MANRYWVGGGSSVNWNATGNTNWGTASNTQDNASVPGSNDDVFFDGVGTGASNSTLSASITVKSINFTGYTNTLTHNDGIGLIVAGSLTFVSGMTYTAQDDDSSITITGTGTITTAGKLMGDFIVDGIGITVTLADNFNTINDTEAKFKITNGTVKFDGAGDSSGLTHTFVGEFNFDSSNIKTLTLGTAYIYCRGISGNGNNTTFNCGTSTIDVTTDHNLYDRDWDLYLPGSSMTFYTLKISGNGTLLHQGTAWTCTNFIRTVDNSIDTGFQLNSSGFTVTGTLTLAGYSATKRLLIQGNLADSAKTITITGATMAWSNVDFSNISLSASYDASAITGRCGDCGGNTNITFTTADDWYWNGSGTRNLSDYTYWYTATNGGGSQMASTRPPLPQDTLYIDANSIDGATTIDQDMVRIPGIDFTGCAAMNFHMNNVNQEIYGGITFGTNVTLSMHPNQAINFVGRGTHVINQAGKSFTQGIEIKSVGGTYILGGNFSHTGFGETKLVNGTFDADIYDLSFWAFSSSNSNTRTLNMGSGTWTCGTTGDDTIFSLSTTDNLTFNKETATLVLGGATGNQTFRGGSKTFNDVSIVTGSGTLTFTGATNGFATFTVIAPKTVKFTAGTTTTITSLVAVGTLANPITITSATAATHTLSDTTGLNEVKYCTISYSTAQGGASWLASISEGNTDGGNNSGWDFSPKGNAILMACEF